jgi:hypothetical protein
VPRNLKIFFPDRRPEYWLTSLVFKPGENLPRGGVNWTVMSIGEPESEGEGKHMSVTVRRDDTQRPRVGRRSL